MEQGDDPGSDSSDTAQWARAVDQPGFQDNVSAHNTLSLMLRAQIPEVGHNTTQHNTTQHNTTQHAQSDAAGADTGGRSLHNTIQHNTTHSV